MANKRKGDYFRLPTLFWTSFTLLAYYLSVCSLYKPEWVPYDYMGPLGAIIRYLANEHPQLIKGTLLFLMVVHPILAIYAVILCRGKSLNVSSQIKWALSTVIFGVFSLQQLKKYEPPNQD